MGRINQPATLLDQMTLLRKEMVELRRHVGNRLPVAFAPARTQDMPNVVSDGFETVWVAELTRTHPRFECHTIDGCDEGTAGEGRIVIAGEVVSSWHVGAGLDRARRGPFVLPADQVRIEVAYRRTTGTGNVYGAVTGAVALM